MGIEKLRRSRRFLLSSKRSWHDYSNAYEGRISPLNLAIFHSAAEIFEVIITDSTATSLMSWIDHAKELRTALYSSSPGSNKKDGPARLLEWIDGGLVYQRNEAIGLLRYAAVLASGRDAHMASNTVLPSDMMDVDHVVGEFSSISDGSIIDNLIGKCITEKEFPGVILRDSSIAQLTTAFRILAFISDNSVVAAALYDEGAIMVIHAVMINCKLMFERSSNIYDYLVVEGTERNSTSDLLLDRNREKSLLDLLIPSLVRLINLLQKLQEAKEQRRNTKLMNALLQLHREVSPKLAACASELTHSFPDIALGFGAVCHLLASALACWPLYSWTPDLFHFLLDSLHANSLLAMGPKETCSLFCLLNDFLPDERIWLWKNEMPMQSALRSLAVGTLLGPEKEKQISWYLRPGHPEKLVAQLSPQFAKLGEIILHCAISCHHQMSVVIQDILRVFIIRIACLKASILLKPIILRIFDWLSGPPIMSEVDTYKPLLLKEDGFQMLTKVLERCIGAANSDVKQFPENLNSKTSMYDRNTPDNFTAEECLIFWSYLLRFCMVLPVGRELLACLSAFKEMGSYTPGQNALLSIFMHIQSSTVEPFESQIKHEGDASLSLERVAAIKFFFGVKNEDCLKGFVEESQKHMEELTNLLGSDTSNEASCDTLPRSYEVKETANLLLLLLQKSSGTEEDAIIANGYTSLLTPPVCSMIHKIVDRSMKRIEDYCLDEFEAKFLWEQVFLQKERSQWRGQIGIARGGNLVAEATAQSTFSRGSAPVTTPSGPTQRATFRQRKPNTSRPPSMHVDDYVARERNADGTNNSNVIAVPRIGSSSRRPPSIHVDEFMARQKDCQNVVGIAVSDAAAQVKTTAPGNNIDAEKSSKPQQLKADLEDDLQRIEIVFDAEESEPDDKLPFPQPDDILPASVVVEQHSPHSVFSHLGTPFASNIDENTMSEFSSRMSAAHPDMPLTQELTLSSDKKSSDQSDDKSFPIRNPSAIDSSAIASSSGDSASVYVNTPSSSGQFHVDSRIPPKLYSKPNLQQSGTVPLGTGSQGLYSQKFPSNQTPLPPMPPPPTVSPVLSQNMDYAVGQSTSFVKSVADVQAQVSRGSLFYITDYLHGFARSEVWTGISFFSWGIYKTSSASSSYTTTLFLSSLNNSTSQSPQYFQTVGNSEHQQYSVAHSIDVLSIPSFTQLQRLQPPQIPRPPSQHLRPPVPVSPQSEQGSSLLQGSLQIPAQSSQVLQQPQVSLAYVYYQTQQQENVLHSLQQKQIDLSQRILDLPGDGTSQQQDSGMSLQEYFKSPEAIQSLLSDRDKLCQLLEQHRKLMQMLQERLGQL
ncbi:hypothetical protein Pfo_011898 [Paulownia fortunei]|nr:hypothetical protein Pfo_011898 [Paulownia fortunei]